MNTVRSSSRSVERGRRGRRLMGAIVLLSVCGLQAASLSDWQYQQDIQVDQAGLAQVSLPAGTLDAARPGLEDLRLADAQGNEVPFLINQPKPAPQTLHPVKGFQSTLEGQSTVLLIETGLPMPIESVLLHTPARQFIKAVRVEGSQDARHWQVIANGAPIFKQARGASYLEVKFTAGEWLWLQLTVDDRRSEPVPFTGASLRTAPQVIPPTTPVPVSITARDEGPNETRLTLDLSAANLMLASIEVKADDPLFTREVTLAVPQVIEDGVREQTLASGTLLRFGGNGQPEVVQQTLTVDRQVPSREAVLRIRNEDSPPLSIRKISARRWPVNLLFQAPAAGVYRLLVGNPICEKPRYDIAALSSQLRTQDSRVLEATIGDLSANPEFQVPEALPGLSLVGAPLDVSPWRYRKPIHLEKVGAQALELDLEVLARAQRDLADLRLVSDGLQVPFLIEHTSITRGVQPSVLELPDPKRPTVSRWSLKLPLANLPLNHLVCESSTPLFERRVRLFEEVMDTRGARRIRELGSAAWARTPDRKRGRLELTLSQSPQTDTLLLETDNGDNPPIQLSDIKLFHPVTRLVFKAATNDAIMLYYGNAGISGPNYDLRLMGRQLLAAPKGAATLSGQEELKASSWSKGAPLTGIRGILFWSVLGAVVLVLLIIISRLLPKSSSEKADP